MPVSIQSRYAGLPVCEAPDAKGELHPTVAMHRHLPPPADTPVYRHRITGAETIEYLAWRYYGSSEAWWRIAEANPRWFPLDLQTGTDLAIPGLQDVGRFERTRTF